MTTAERQAVFDAVARALVVHAPDIPEDRRIAIATDVAIKVRDVVEGRAKDWP